MTAHACCWYNYEAYFRRTTIYAIVEISGKQYRVVPGQTLEVDKLAIEQGISIDLDRVLLIGDGEKVIIGAPVVEGAKVVATSKGEKRGEKILIGKFKAKVRYRRKKGHIQTYTVLTIDKIVAPGIEAVAPKAKAVRAKKTTEPKAEAVEPKAEAVVAEAKAAEPKADTAEAPKKPRRRKKEVTEDGA